MPKCVETSGDVIGVRCPFYFVPGAVVKIYLLDAPFCCALGEATTENDVATFVPPGKSSCTITLKFLPKRQRQFDQAGYEYGFGMRVCADGTYRKVSGVKPTFDNSR